MILAALLYLTTNNLTIIHLNCLFFIKTFKNLKLIFSYFTALDLINQYVRKVQKYMDPWPKYE